MTLHSIATPDLKDLARLLINESAESTLEDHELITKLDFHGATLLAAEQNNLPASLGAHIVAHKAAMAANDKLKRIELALLFDAVNDIGLKAVLIKGSALAYSLYTKPWLRPRSDNDILIAASDRIEFDRLFTELGYQKLFAIEGKYISYQSTYGKQIAGGSFVNIDLHWRINNRQMFYNTFSATELIGHGQQINAFGTCKLRNSINIPSEVDSLLIACVHRSGHHNHQERLIWLYDIHLLASRLSDEQWTQLCEKAITKCICAITLDALETCQYLLQTKIKVKVMETLRDATANKEASAIFLDHSLSERHYYWADIKSMPSLRSKLIFLRETLFPSPAYVRQRMNSRSTTVAYLKRLVNGFKRVL